MMSSEIHSDEMAKVTVTAFVEEDIKDGLKALADVERRSMSQMMAVLIERAVLEAREKGVIAPVEQQGK
jgi:CopG-like RHH_1 or ribbon-helix-helix domain, RHH_5